MKEISLTRGKVALVDDHDFEYLSQFTWYAQRDPRKTVGEVWYARRFFRDALGKQRGIQMQRDLMHPAAGFVVCFRNHNGLDVRRENLIVTTRSADLSRRRLKERSLPRGVKARAQRFEARILNGAFVGTFDTPEEASSAYQAARRRLGLDEALPRGGRNHKRNLNGSNAQPALSSAKKKSNGSRSQPERRRDAAGRPSERNGIY